MKQMMLIASTLVTGALIVGCSYDESGSRMAAATHDFDRGTADAWHRQPLKTTDDATDARTVTYASDSDFNHDKSVVIRDDDGDLVVRGDTSDTDSSIYAYEPPDAKTTATTSGVRDANATISTWPEVSRKAAQDMIQKYGPPNGVMDTMLVWNNNGPWKCTMVTREAVKHSFPMEHEDCLVQSISYRVPVEKFDDLAQFDGSVMCARTAGCLSAMCDNEAMNFVAINLANDICIGKKSVDEARQALADAARAYKNGERVSIAQELQFDVVKGNAGDPDKPIGR